MIIVTGGLGFIGSNLVKRLNKENEVIIVDNYSDFKIRNIKGLEIKDFFEKKNFIRLIKKNNFNFKNITHIFHLGACTNTAEKDKKYLYENNFLYSKDLLKFSNNNNIKFIYASSASIYGNIKSIMKENIFSKNPLNLYAWSKILFDQFVLKNKKKLKNTIGLRYFNVYGNNEFHKSKMCSPVLSFYNQLKKNKYCKIFKNYGGYDDGQHSRDFIYVEDVVNINMWMMNKKLVEIFNVGTGYTKTFNSVAELVIKELGYGKIKYIDFPDIYKKKYQTFTKASLLKLRNYGYKNSFITLQQGVRKYIRYLNEYYKKFEKK
jgi:ADP-L-glycero-D-manno-heptose 6-epimerase